MKSTVRDEINITQSGPSADGATVAKKKEWLINRARYTNDDLLYVAAPTFYNWMKTDRYFLYDLFNYLKSLHHPTEKIKKQCSSQMSCNFTRYRK